MKQVEAFFTGSSGTQIYYQSWLPEGDSKAVVIISHGLAEHSGRYLNVVNQLVPSGFSVYALDHYGHGKSDGPRVFVPLFEEFTNTLKMFYDLVRAQNSDKKTFLLGHSVGSLICANYLLDHQEGLTGAVLSGPATKVPSNITSITVFLSKTLSAILPMFGVTALDANSVSRDKAVVDAYVNDPLVYTGKITSRMGAELLRGMQQLREHMAAIKLPIYIIHGSEDRMADPESAQELYDGISSEDKTIKYYEGFYHEVFNDFGKEQVLADLQAWFEAHL
jgi:alpha-beta hydrolase superfamily lysophospholipase